MFKQFLKSVTEISQSLKDSVFASLAWSGATRAANELTLTNPDQDALAVYLKLASLANKVSVSELRPTTEAVMDLMLTAPEMATATETGIKQLKDAGEDVSNLEQLFKQDHQNALIRHDRQSTALGARHEAITEALDKAFSTKTRTMPEVPYTLEQALHDKVMEKVQARRRRLVVDIAGGRNLSFAPEELAKINQFLKNVA